MTPAARATALMLAAFAAVFVVAAVAMYRFALRGLTEEDMACATPAGTRMTPTGTTGIRNRSRNRMTTGGTTTRSPIVSRPSPTASVATTPVLADVADAAQDAIPVAGNGSTTAPAGTWSSARGCGWTGRSIGAGTKALMTRGATSRRSRQRHLRVTVHRHRLAPGHEWLLWTVSVVTRFYRYEDGGPKSGVVLASLFVLFALVIGANQ